jgi:hypothetical protein
MEITGNACMYAVTNDKELGGKGHGDIKIW